MTSFWLGNLKTTRSRFYQSFRWVDDVDVAVGSVGDDEGRAKLALGRRDVADELGLSAALRLAFDLGDRLVHRPQALVGGVVLKYSFY